MTIRNEKINEPLDRTVLSAWNKADGRESYEAEDIVNGEEWNKHLALVRNEAGFHWRNGIYFRRISNGVVRVTHFYDWNYKPNYSCWDIPASEWASIVCSVSAMGETAETYQAAQRLHKGEHD